MAIVAGGCGGIGSVISYGLAHLGATVVIADHREDQACECVEGIVRQGFTSHAIGFEIAKPESITAMVDEAARLAGRVDILVNCVDMHIEKPTEWARPQITVNAVAPTFIRTDLVKHCMEDRNFYNGLVGRIPLGWVGQPLDVAVPPCFWRPQQPILSPVMC